MPASVLEDLGEFGHATERAGSNFVGDEAMALERTEQPATDLLLGDAERGEVKLSELWSKGPVVLYFHRHFG